MKRKIRNTSYIYLFNELHMSRRTARKGQRQCLSTLLHCLPLSLSLKLSASVSYPAPKTRPELLAGFDEEYQNFAAASSFVQEMGTASVKSRNLIAFVFNPFIVRLITLPFSTSFFFFFLLLLFYSYYYYYYYYYYCYK